MRGRASLVLLAFLAGCGTPRPPVVPGQPGGQPGQPSQPGQQPAPSAPGMPAAPAPGSPGPALPAEDLAAVIRPGLALAPSQFPFEDPTTPEERLTGRYFLGRWVATAEGVQQEETPPSPSVTIRRYSGKAFGTESGMAPAHYRIEAELQAYEKAGLGPEDIPGSPVGALAVLPYFRDTSHYVLMVATPTQAQVWIVDGLRPGDEWDASKHRRWLYQLPAPIAVGDTVKWGAEIDTKRQSIKVFLNGELRSSFFDPFIQEGEHSVALFSNGNFVRYTALALKPL